jgi:hypothetical protein
MKNYFAKTTPIVTHTKTKARELTAVEKVDSSLESRRLLRKPASESTSKKPTTRGKSSQE